MVHLRHFLTVFPLMTAALFCYFFTFLLKKGVQKRVPQNRIIIRKTHFMGGYPKKPWTHFVIFYEGQLSVSGCPLSFAKITVFSYGTERTDGRTDIGSEKLPDVIGASRNYTTPLVRPLEFESSRRRL